MARFRDWLPPEIVRLARDWSGRGVCFKGEYASWEAAAAKALGYDANAILERALQATLAVREGRAVFERDGVLFASPDYPYPLLAGLLRVAAMEGGCLNVLDFGGALGSSYFQCRPWLKNLHSLRWQVVEQPHFVACGRDRLADGILDFVERIEDCAIGGVPNVALLSGVLQYVPEPRQLLARIVDLGVRNMIVDRTPIIEGDQDILSVQVVPTRIVYSSYPVRLFSRSSVLQPLEHTYRVLCEYPAVDGVLGGLSRRVEFKGFILEGKI